MAKKDELGRWGETLAAEHLRRSGYELIERNWRCAGGEIDLVARHRDALVIVEVKTRSSIAFGHPFEAVTPVKLARLHRLGYAWCAANPGRHGPIRVDVVSVVGFPDSQRAPVLHVFQAVRG